MPHTSSTMAIIGHGKIYMEIKDLYRESLHLMFPAKVGQVWTSAEHNQLFSHLINDEGSLYSKLLNLESKMDIVNKVYRPADYQICTINYADSSAVEGNKAWGYYSHRISSADDMFKPPKSAKLPLFYDAQYLEYEIQSLKELEGKGAGLSWKIYISQQKFKKVIESPDDEDVISEHLYYMTPSNSLDKEAYMDMKDVLHKIYKIRILCDKSSEDIIKMVYLDDAKDHAIVREAEESCINPCTYELPFDMNVMWCTCRVKGNVWEVYAKQVFGIVNPIIDVIGAAESYMIEGYYGDYEYA